MYIKTTRIHGNTKLAKLVFLVTTKISTKMGKKQTKYHGPINASVAP